MHNNVMAAGSKDCPPMLGPGRYSQWRSHESLNVDACNTANKMGSIERYKQGESLEVQIQKCKSLALLAVCSTYIRYLLSCTKLRGTNTTSASTDKCITRNKGKEIAKQLHLNLMSVLKETVILNKLRGIRTAKEFGTPYKDSKALQTYQQQPSNSSNSRNKTEDTTPRYNNDNQSGIALKHISVYGKIQEVFTDESSSTGQPLKEYADERAALANLIANLTLDTEENKTILKQLKKLNASLTQELEECKTNLYETNRALGEATSCRDSCLIALQNK
ncbi:hypothetical protein Tco_1092764 [Tanacetum coccineum]|uniref:Uncharacterized protein n=1 Tax=Tanacetum coccineum TaxID=301880 RepID=A0ABQ5IAS8_9ASTR